MIPVAMRREKSVVEQLVSNRSSFYILKLQWEVNEAYELAEAISRNRTVKYVFLYDNFLASVSMNERKEILKSVACLEKLESIVYVSHSTRVKIPVDSLVTILKSSKKLTTFELHGPSLVGKSTDFLDFTQALAELRSLKTFKLLPAYFDKKVDLDPLVESLSKLDALEEIRMCLYCEKGSRLTTTPLHRLCELQMLKILDIRWPHLADEHVTAIASMLRYNTMLTELRIGGNNLSYSCFSIAELLEYNIGIRRLSLACRGLGNDECFKAIWKAMGINSHLKEATFEKTDTASNRWQDSSIELMEKVLKDNKSLTTLRLYNMDVDDDICMALSRALTVNSTLKELDLRKGNKQITDVGYEALASMLESNYTLYSLLTNASGGIKKQMDVCLKLNQSAEKIAHQHDFVRGPAGLDPHGTAGLLLCGNF